MQTHRKSRPVCAVLRFTCRNFAPRSVTALLLIGSLTALHAFWLHGIAYNSDEGQHLHVAWSWTQGLLPYRDVFDNHGPLFGLIMRRCWLCWASVRPWCIRCGSPCCPGLSCRWFPCTCSGAACTNIMRLWRLAP